MLMTKQLFKEKLFDENFLKIIKVVSKRKKILLVYLLFFMLISSLVESFTITSFLPFLEILSNNSDISGINKTFFGVILPSNRVGIFVIFSFAVIAASVIRIINTFLTVRIASSISSEVSVKVYKNVLQQPYLDYIKSDTPSLIATTTNYTEKFSSCLNSSLQAISAAILAVTILITLFRINFFITVVPVIILAVLYSIISLSIKKLVVNNSKLVSDSMRGQISSLQDGFYSIRDIILDKSSNLFISDYAKYDYSFRRGLANNALLTVTPKYLLETTAILTVSFTGLLFQGGGEQANVVPYLGTVALASQRLLPAFQQIFAGWIELKAFKEQLNLIVHFLEKRVENFPPNRKLTNNKNIKFNSLQINKIDFAYESRKDYAVKNITFDVIQGDRVALVGATGSGKSTLMDILMGLMPADSGQLTVNELNLYKYTDSCDSLLFNLENIQIWRSMIAHVPQTIYMVNSSIKQNIILENSIHMNTKRLTQAINIAELNSVISSMPHGINENVGENGIKLSGGQKQRIGIARAIYKNKPIIFLDEATSALDEYTESKIISSIQEQIPELTLFMITHRLRSTKICNKIFRLTHGRIDQ